MASFIFICLKASRVVDTSYDWAIFCVLLALELPQYLRLIVYWRSKR